MKASRLFTILIVLGFSLALTQGAGAQMMGSGMMGGMMHRGHGMGMGGMGMGPMCGMGGGVRAACMADLHELGLSEDTQKELETKRFELQKSVIRKRADFQILRLELQHLLEDRNFDLATAREKVLAMTGIETELRSAHLEFLHELGSKLTDEQWQELQERSRHGMMDMGRGKHSGMMGGGMMHGDMMMHHGDSSEEAERFFEQE